MTKRERVTVDMGYPRLESEFDARPENEIFACAASGLLFFLLLVLTLLTTTYAKLTYLSSSFSRPFPMQCIPCCPSTCSLRGRFEWILANVDRTPTLHQHSTVDTDRAIYVDNPCRGCALCVQPRVACRIARKTCT